MAARLVTVLLGVFLSLDVLALGLTQTLQHLEERSQGRLGVAVLDGQNERLWSYQGSQRFPLMNTFKTLACAKLLYQIQHKNLWFGARVPIQEKDLVSWSPISEHFSGGLMSLRSLCTVAMLMSDNHATNLVLEYVGGPQGLTHFLRHIVGDPHTRLDRIEPELNSASPGDPRDTTTPEDMVQTLKALLYDDGVLERVYRRQLRQWMSLNVVADDLMRPALPQAWRIADRSGADQQGSRGITAMLWKKDRKPLFIAIYLTQTQLSLAERNRVIEEVSHVVFAQFGIVDP